MCGIFGYVFQEGFSEGRRAILAQHLAEANDRRGGHSWGFCQLDARPKENNDSGWSIFRGLGTAAEEAHILVGSRSFFGHCRYATHGEKTVTNAHPFEVGKIVGAHNGIIWNHEELCTKYDRDFKVDSQHLFAHLDAGLSFDEIVGYGAIEWMNLESGEIYLSRLFDGELSIYGIGDYDGEINGVVWSSDKDHLRDSIDCAGIEEFFPYRIHEGEVYIASSEGLKISNQDKLKLSGDSQTIGVEKKRNRRSRQVCGSSTARTLGPYVPKYCKVCRESGLMCVKCDCCVKDCNCVSTTFSNSSSTYRIGDYSSWKDSPVGKSCVCRCGCVTVRKFEYIVDPCPECSSDMRYSTTDLPDNGNTTNTDTEKEEGVEAEVICEIVTCLNCEQETFRDPEKNPDLCEYCGEDLSLMDWVSMEPSEKTHSQPLSHDTVLMPENVAKSPDKMLSTPEKSEERQAEIARQDYEGFQSRIPGFPPRDSQ